FAAAEEHAEQEQRDARLQQLQSLARLGGREARGDRHRAEHLGLDHELAAALLHALNLHQSGVVRRVEDHCRAPTFEKSRPRSSNTRIAVARPAPKTPPPGCWNGPTRYSRSQPGTVFWPR